MDRNIFPMLSLEFRALTTRRTQIDDLQFYAPVCAPQPFIQFPISAPFILIRFDLTNAHVDNYNAIAVCVFSG